MLMRNDIEKTEMWRTGTETHRIVIAGREPSVQPWEPFDERVLRFWERVSVKLDQKEQTRRYPDVMAFLFWCRKRNLEEYQRQYRRTHGQEIRMGKGLVFHITPSNVPTVFAYSLIFGMLSGNVNVVRVSGKKHPQTELMIQAIAAVMDEAEFQEFQERVLIVSYEHPSKMTEYFSENAAIRVIWGGDQTIRAIRQIPAHPRCQDFCFADRISAAILDCAYVLTLDEEERSILAQRFYQDTYLMDQNACSSPRFILWRGRDRVQCEKAADIFWTTLEKWIISYRMDEKRAYDKYWLFCETAKWEGEHLYLRKRTNALYRAELEALPQDQSGYAGRFGLFYEGFVQSLDEIAPMMTERMQTITVAGIQKEEVAEWVLSNHLRGIDRIVSFGEAMQMEPFWDGYDLIGQFSRVVYV